MTKRIEMAGKKFGRLTVLEYVGNKNNVSYWKCQCECGNIKSISGYRLRSGGTKSCGCLVVESITTHGYTVGGTETPEYHAWHDMRQRCNNKNNKRYHDYGGRGIKVCKQWGDFDNFYKDMGKRPSSDHSLERVDNNKGYQPDNCVWANRVTQQRNTRLDKRNKTGVRGVSVVKNTGKYKAYISVNRKFIIIGNYDTLEEAAEARKKAEQKYWKSS